MTHHTNHDLAADMAQAALLERERLLAFRARQQARIYRISTLLAVAEGTLEAALDLAESEVTALLALLALVTDGDSASTTVDPTAH